MSFGWRRSVALGALAFGLASGVVPGAGPLAVFSPRPAAAQTATFDLFFSNLDSYGTWIPDDEFGYIWTPQVGPDWRPYQRGNWVWTDDYGWMWQSSEPFAWATYHYGRWGWNQFTGWYWVPGDEWAPAWVSWRHGGGVIGWAPLGPVGRGYAYGAPDRWEAPPQNTWVFVSDRDFTAPDLYGRLLPPAAVPGAWRAADRVYYPARGNGYMENRFLPRDEIARISVRPPQVRRVVPVDRRPDTRFYDDRVEVYRPRIDGRAPARPVNPVMDRPRRDGLNEPYPARPDLGPARPGPAPVYPNRPSEWGPPGTARPDHGRPGQPGQPARPDAGRPSDWGQAAPARPERPRPDQPGRPDAGRPSDWGPPGTTRPDHVRPGQPGQPARPDAGRPSDGNLTPARPERPRPDQTGRPDAGRPSEWGPPGGSRPDAVRPSDGNPGAARPDRPRPDQTGRPDAGRPSDGNPGAARPDRPRPDQTGRPDAGRPSDGNPGAARPDRPRPDQTGRPDAGHPPAGNSGAGRPDHAQPAQPVRPARPNPDSPSGGQRREPQQVAPGTPPQHGAPADAGQAAHKRPPRPETE